MARRNRQQGQPVNPELANYEQNYWADDREDVLANMRGLGPSQNVVPDEPEPVQQMDRNTFRDAWMGAGQMTPQQADQWLKQHGAQQLQGGAKAGRWQVPGGDQLDLQIGRGHALASGGMITPGWTAIGGGGQVGDGGDAGYGGQQDWGGGQGYGNWAGGPSPSAQGSMFGAMNQGQQNQQPQNRMQQGMGGGSQGFNRPMQKNKPMFGSMQPQGFNRRQKQPQQGFGQPNYQAQQNRFGMQDPQQQPKVGF